MATARYLSDLPHHGIPALAILKEECPHGELLQLLTGQVLADKGITPSAARFLGQHGLLSSLLGHLLMQAPQSGGIARQLARYQAERWPSPIYTGSHRENRAIDLAIFCSNQQGRLQDDGGMRATTWRGAAGCYVGLTVPSVLKDIRTVIIGGGASGILAGRALANAGLRQVVVLERKGSAGVGGIWNMGFTRRILHAVPFPLRFEEITLEKGPQPGQEITSFLERLVSPPSSLHWHAFPRVLHGEVVCVKPGDLSHTVTYLDEHGREREIVAPLVINAIGVGEPLHPSWGSALTTDLAPHETGIRWQDVWDEQKARRYHQRKLVFVSLSNATLSMLWQVHAWNQRGMDIDYHVITHYPQESVEYPHQSIEHQGRTYRLYRDLEEFQLLRVAADMIPFRKAFEEARAAGKIQTNVRHWTLSRQGEQQVVVATGKSYDHSIPCDDLFTLIGYGPRASTLEAMGLHVNHPHLGAASQDYDGEVQREPGTTGRDRVYPGYFCLGIRNGFNDNEMLLPGLLYRLPMLVAGVLMRASEYAARRQ